MAGRLRLWDVVLVGALALMIAGMFLPWWGFNPAEFLTSFGLPGTAALLGMSADVNGWGAPLSGLGVAAIIMNAVALGFAALKLFFQARTPLPAWYKEGWVVAVLGSLCTLFGVIVCVAAPSGGFIAWNWRPGSALLLGGGVVMLVAGVAMSRDQSGSYQGACGAVITPDSLFCPGCGGRVAAPAPETGVAGRCTRCDAPLASDAAFCSMCGWRV